MDESLVSVCGGSVKIHFPLWKKGVTGTVCGGTAENYFSVEK